MEIVWKRVRNTVYAVSSEGEVANTDTGRVLRQTDDGHGYLAVTIWQDTMSAKEKVHRLVASAFLSQPEGANTVNHKNGVKTDNRVVNLEWLSHADNMKHAWREGLMHRGSDSVLSVLTEESVLKIELLMQKGLSNAAIAQRFGVVRGTVSKIRSKETWKHVAPELELPPAVSTCKPKLTPDDIPEIRALYKGGASLADIGRKFGVHSGTISGIILGKTWTNY